MKRSKLWDPAVLFTWSLVACGLGITMWQGWNCILRYLSQPMRVEEEFVSLALLPPVQLSICKVFTVRLSDNYPTDDEDIISIEEMDDNLSGNLPLDEDYGPTGTGNGIPLYANSAEAFWQGLLLAHEEVKLSDLIDEIDFHNETMDGWDAIYTSAGPKNETSQFEMGFYPFASNSVLLCFTLRTGLAEFGNRLRILPSFRASGELSAEIGLLAVSIVGNLQINGCSRIQI